MGLFDDLRAGIAAAEGAIAGLGPRPPGDPGALRALAAKVRAQADDAAAAGRLEAGISGSLDFEGPAAKDFAGNVDEVSESLFVAQRMLDDAADTILREARKIEHAQRDHDHARGRLLDQIADLGRELGRVVR